MKTLEENSPASMNAVRQALNLLLGSDSCDGECSVKFDLPVFILTFVSVKSEGVSEAVQAIHLANDFSIRFCQLKLRLLCVVDSAGETKNNILDIMFKTAVSNVRSGTSHWVDLISILGQDAARQVSHCSVYHGCPFANAALRFEKKRRRSFYLLLFLALASSLNQLRVRT